MAIRRRHGALGLAAGLIGLASLTSMSPAEPPAAQHAAASRVASSVRLANVAEPRAAFPGSDGRLVFESPVSGVCCDLFSMRPNGRLLRRLTRFTPDSAAVGGSWSPDGRSIVFRVQTPGNTFGPSHIWIMKADGAGRHAVLNGEDRYFNPSFSANGARIVFTRCRPDFSGCALFRVNLDGTNITQITVLGHRGVQDFDPRYSPAGGRIAFTSFNRGGIRAAIYTVHPDGTSVQRVTPARLQGFQPDWHPRGRLLVFASNCCGAGNPAIWRIRADGARLKQLSHPGARSDLKPVFSPSGVWIAFERLPQGAPLDAMPSLWVMKSDGSGSHLVRRRADHVSWGPAPQT